VTFELDDVREAFAEDTQRYLGQLSAGVTEANVPALDEQRWLDAWQAMRAGTHGLAGSSSLLGLDHLARPARLLEGLLEVAADAFSSLNDARERASAIVDVFRDALPALTTIVAHELAGEREAATEKGQLLVEVVERVARGTERHAREERIAVKRLVDDEWDTYLDEASELLDNLSDAIVALDEGANAIPTLMQLFHTLKGATNTAGLGPIGAQIHIVESALEHVHDLTAERRRDLASALARVTLSIRDNLALAATSGEVRVAELPTPIRILASVTAPRSVEAPSDEIIASAPVLRVGSERVDSLLDLAGELVAWRSRLISRVARMQSLGRQGRIRHAAISQAIDSFTPSPSEVRTEATTPHLELDVYTEVHVLSNRLEEIAADIRELQRDLADELQLVEEGTEELGGIVVGLQHELKEARMVSVGELLGRLRMPILDAAARAGKLVDVVVEGEHHRLDKSLSDALYAPLLHVVRNAVAHGIEDATTRTTAQKSPRGRITLRARPGHELIVLEVEDDGAGIDTSRLRELGISHRLVPPDISEDDPRVLSLVFAPGISTSDLADDLAGRGVGGDVVRTRIDRLRGSISIATRRGLGTKFSFSLPLAISIAHVILARAGETLIAVPLSVAHLIVRRQDAVIVESERGPMLSVDGRVVPICAMSELVGYRAAISTVLLVCMLGDRDVAIELDAVVGHEEVVVKQLGVLLEGHPLFLGCAARGDGEVALVLDVRGVFSDRLESRLAPAAVRRSEERRRVLFVDDSVSIRKVAQRLFGELGVDVVTVADGRAALDQIRAGGFSLVFTDLEMPEMNGYELLRELQQLPAPRTPVIVMSSRSGGSYVEQAMQLGASAYLTKPFTSQTLAAAISHYAVS
jgi:chemosensory pili system protein ChpA (sensor histidine kinase/response regulator)